MTLTRVSLHEHLDGALRPATILELAAASGHRLPADDLDGLIAYFDQTGAGSLPRYLEAFAHTVAVMQTATSIERVAVEMIEDLASDDVAYAEIRFAPMQHLTGGLSLEEVVQSAIAGCARAGSATGVRWGLILDAIRSERDSLEVADLAGRFADGGVVGFDLAGRELGFPPDDHLAAIRRAREFGLGLTIHAGEAGGVASIAGAVNRCGTDRIGHGIDIIDDCVVKDGRIVELGPVASVVQARGIPLEVCPVSNLQTKGWKVDRHPVAMLDDAGFTITISPDNRLMSGTTLDREYSLLSEAFGFGPADFVRFNQNAARAAFTYEDRAEILAAVGSA